VVGGHLPGIAQITTVLFSVMFATTSLGQLFAPIMAMVRAASAAAEIFATIDSPVPDMTGLKDPDVSPNVDIKFKDVSFAYPTRKDTTVLDKLNLQFETGKTTALVGPSGSGKSTVVGLLQRWYHPVDPRDIKPNDDKNKRASSEQDVAEKEKAGIDTGAETASDAKAHPVENEITSSDPSPENEDTGVFIGETNLNKIDVRWWRSNVGLVQQEPFLFNDTIFNNVSWGLSGTQSNDLSKEEKFALVEKACKESYAHEFIQRLPEVREVFCYLERSMAILTYIRATIRLSEKAASSSAVARDSVLLSRVQSSSSLLSLFLTRRRRLLTFERSESFNRP
jgi:ATP-binding cassette subfamily B (MDR/TAP) protein 1